MPFVTSRYNFRLPVETGYAVFNASTGSILRLEGDDSADLSTILAGQPTTVSCEDLGLPLTRQLQRGGFIVDERAHEVEAIRERYWAARGRAPVVLVVTTTMDCNLGCYYCYETRAQQALEVADVSRLVDVARKRLDSSGKRSLHIDWYGGEPLLNAKFLEQASLALQDLCRMMGARYHASVVSNGTRWPDDVAAFVARHKIRQVQISFDGLRDNHDRRRRYRLVYRRNSDVSSFEQAAALVDRLLMHTRVDVRYNADRGNMGDFSGFIDQASMRGWFGAPHRCVVMVAALASYSERSDFMRRRQLNADELEALEEIARRKLPQEAQDDRNVVHGFPYPKTSVCGALAFDSSVIGADGLEYRCGLQVGETQRAVGPFRPCPSNHLGFGDRRWWEEFDPTRPTRCSRCSFLPLCWGGCPKRHLEQSEPDLDTECEFWRRNLPRMLADGLEERIPAAFAFGETEQFRGPR